MYKVTSKWQHQDTIKVEWNLGKRCNLDCAYCPAEIHDNYSPHTDIDILFKTVDKLASLDKPVRVSFTGGEPCVHPHIEKLISYAKQKLAWVNVTTNGLRSGEWYSLQPVSHYVFSLHFDNVHWQRALTNIINFSGYEDGINIPFQVNLMAHHEYIDDVKSAADMLDTVRVPYVVRRIRWTEKHDWFDDMRYNSKDLDWILSTDSTAKPNCIIDNKLEMHANDIIKKNMNQFEGWSCNAGVESLMINWDGEVHRATCRVGGSLGNIYNGTFTVPSEPIKCTRNWCTCAADIPLTKINTDSL